MVALLASTSARKRRQVGAALVTVTALAWGYLLFLTFQMGNMGSSFAMPMTSNWNLEQALRMWAMWAVMMAGMMIPSAAPMISAYAGTSSRYTDGLRGSTPLFVAGYLAIWSGFGVAATAAQWALHDAALVTAMGVSTSARLGGAILIGAGLYQFTDVKDRCLSKCRSPLGFLLNEWRPGNRGALVMGIRHGTLCVGCCWALMALLFVLGVMNLWWIALVSAVVLLEKVIPRDALTGLLGVTLVAWGLGLAAGLGL